MKRLFFSAVALMMMSAAFASNSDSNSNILNNNEKMFDMSYNVRKLGCRLDMTVDQVNATNEIQKVFVNEMKAAGETNGNEKHVEAKQAVKTNFEKMRYILNQEQFDKYVALMETTFENKGLNEYLK